MLDAVSAIVVTFRTGPALRSCLSALARDPAVSEILVVDNGNDPETEHWLDAWAAATANARVLRGAGNVGFGSACNVAARQASGPWLLFVNPDLKLAEGAADRLRSIAESRPQPVAVGGRVIGPDGREQRGSRREEVTPWSMLVAAFGLGRLERFFRVLRDPHREHDTLPSAPIQVAAVSGALFVMERSAFFMLGGFDESYFLHVEDIDLFRRVREQGGEVWFHPQASGVHVGASSAVGSSFVERHKARSFQHYFRKFARGPFDRLVGDAAALILGFGFTLRGWIRDLLQVQSRP